ncbi:C39 family peptidase [Actinomycetospora cinnamomea]|uniref:Peptidase C39-like protein n=1 Tax=Actinomycetospora cinnamomea TaxID=663609 RepID=A0A2U1EVH7_9PSEU|nr:C39 family peptidase [Actinomycetospora cinnamomea]PVZ03911.1 peptidase C39-like protein [Actinomycetospora cinnamomea]
MDLDPAELFELCGDLDDEGHVDVSAVDTDGDGVLDLGWTDLEGDVLVVADAVHPITDGGRSTDWYRHEENFRDGVLPSEASAARDDGMHGDPEQASSYWYAQSVNGYCVPAAVAQIVGEWQGTNVGETEVVARAVEHGWLTTTDTDGDGTVDDASGMTSSEAEALLESYGIPATTTHGGMDDLAALLDQDRDIVAYVDSDEVWYDAEDDGTDGGADADHAVVVTGIDDENVYLADPGDPSGAIAVVPRETF